MKTYPLLLTLFSFFLNLMTAYSQPNVIRLKPGLEIKKNTTPGIPSPFLQQFQYDSYTYEQKFNTIKNNEKRRICEEQSAENQTQIDQLDRINKLLTDQNYTLLESEYKNRNLSIIDSLQISLNEINYIKITYVLSDRHGCGLPKVQLADYKALQALISNQKAIVNERIAIVRPMQVPQLPRITGNTSQDALAYLTSIRNLLQTYYRKLQTTFAQYQQFEQKYNLTDDRSRLSFRKEFCYGILCEIR